MEEELTETDSVTLQKLQQYGESWLDNEDYEELKKKTTKKRKDNSVRQNSNPENVHRQSTETLSRRQKKKLKQKLKSAEKKESENSGETVKEISSINIQRKASKRQKLEKLKADLGLLDVKKHVADTNEGEKEITSEFSDGSVKVVVFNDPAKRNKIKKSARPILPQNPEQETEDKDQQPEINLRDARFDVKMFGIQGFRSNDKESAIQDWLVKLRAKPPRNKFHNYKDYMVMKSEEKQSAKQQKELSRQFGFKTSSSDNKKRRRKGDHIGYLDGQIGSYRGGVQMLKKEDINRVKRAKTKK